MIDNPEPNRPNPDVLLNHITKKEEKTHKGRLKIFFGMCAGVGKTYSMLKTAQKAKLDGVDVLIGIVETHNRPETEALVKGLEKIPLKEIKYRETIFNELDVDTILKRKPALILVDELAHTNIPGSKHLKRYQDVLEILENGIDVYTTLNVQHIESRSDTVKQITGTTIRETVPDSILDHADEIELVDITPGELLQRLVEGKVYTPESSKQAIQNFFRKGNLTALREMALRITAEKVDKELRDYKSEKNIFEVWKSGQRLMCAISPSPYSANLIRWTRRMAYSMESTWIAVYIETDSKISEQNKNNLLQNFKLVEELGGELITAQDVDVVDGLVRVAKENNITQIFIGKSQTSSLYKIFGGKSYLNTLMDKSRDLDIYIYGGDRPEQKNIKSLLLEFISKSHSGFGSYLSVSIIVSVIATILYFIQDNIGYEVVSLLFLLIVSVLPLFNYRVGPVLFAAFLSAVSWNYFFIPPHFTFHIEKPADVLMFFTYFVVASTSGFLSTKIRTQQNFLKQKEERTSSLFNLSKALSSATNLNDIAETSVKNIEKVFNCNCIFFLVDNNRKLNAKPHSSSSFVVDDYDWVIANWSYTSGRKAGKFTDTLSDADATYYPIKSKSGNLGVFGIKTENNEEFTFDQEEFFINFITQISNAVEREYLNQIAKQSIVTVESEKLYKTLFNSISHELKTPITSIIAATSSLEQENQVNSNKIQSSLIQEIRIAVGRLNRLVENLLDMARLESGKLKLKYTWNGISDVLNSVAARMKEELKTNNLEIKIEGEVPIFQYDFGLIEQALINVIHNSIIYSPQNSIIFILVKVEDGFCKIDIKDSGPGFPPESFEKLFEKFYRVPGTKTGGTGLGLSIAKGLIEAHTGKISAKNNPDYGATFTIMIPIKL
ncbi:MAG: sensor histidine kinase KdpD [Ignavibacteriales bacterium]|nr:sensor histidine kinase KdpD [Ignavibacteriales bacterium]